jgi:DNA double-strand break repair helicase HerA and related ATPase
VGSLSAQERAQVLTASPLAGNYDETVDRESAYEKLKARVEGPDDATVEKPAAGDKRDLVSEILFGRRGPRGGRQSEGLIEAMAKSVARAAGSQAGRSVMRGILGSLRGARR